MLLDGTGRWFETRIVPFRGPNGEPLAIGLRALEVFQAKKDEIKLVLLDVIMPGLDGWQVFLRLEPLDPTVKVLFITGYAASALPEDFSIRGERLLSKPYKPQALLECVRAMLDGAR